jgi:hypothetical protein
VVLEAQLHTLSPDLSSKAFMNNTE